MAGLSLLPSLSPYEYGEGLLHARRLGSTAVFGPHDSPRISRRASSSRTDIDLA